MQEKWIIVDKETHLVRYVIHSASMFIDNFIRKNYFADFICFRENETLAVGPGWLCVFGYGGIHNFIPHREERMAEKPKNIATATERRTETRNVQPELIKIEAVIVCSGYADFLKHTLLENLQHLDHVVVVTTPDDPETIELCRRYSVDVIDTTEFYVDGDVFNKGRAINLALQHLRHDGWLLHLDADTVLPHRFRDMLYRAKLNRQFIYGADRINVRGYENWLKLRTQIEPQFEYRCLVNPPISPTFSSKPHLTELSQINHGGRIVHKEYGYCPIGYFQLWHSSANRRYPINQGSAEHTDLLFSVQWPREKRILLPELFVYHLESEAAPIGTNWRGRKTKRFGP